MKIKNSGIAIGIFGLVNFLGLSLSIILAIVGRIMMHNYYNSSLNNILQYVGIAIVIFLGIIGVGFFIFSLIQLYKQKKSTILIFTMITSVFILSSQIFNFVWGFFGYRLIYDLLNNDWTYILYYTLLHYNEIFPFFLLSLLMLIWSITISKRGLKVSKYGFTISLVTQIVQSIWYPLYYVIIVVFELYQLIDPTLFSFLLNIGLEGMMLLHHLSWILVGFNIYKMKYLQMEQNDGFISTTQEEIPQEKIPPIDVQTHHYQEEFLDNVNDDYRQSNEDNHEIDKQDKQNPI